MKKKLNRPFLDCGPPDQAFPLPDAAIFRLPGAAAALFFSGDASGALYRFTADRGNVTLFQAVRGRWNSVAELRDQFLLLPVRSNQLVAARAADSDATLSIVREPAPQLVVDRIFSAVDKGLTIAPDSVVPGSRLLMTAAVIDPVLEGRIQRRQPRLRFAPSAGSRPVLFPARLVEDGVGPGGQPLAPGWFWISFDIPKKARPGLGRLSVQIGDFLFDGLDFEIQDPRLVETRRRLARLVEKRAADLLESPPAIIGPYSPAPAGVELCNGLTQEHVRSIEEPGQWLFFAFDHETRFEQDLTLWALADGETGEIEILDGQGAWPALVTPDEDEFLDGITCRGTLAAIDFGSPDTQRNQLFGFGPVLNRRPILAAPRPFLLNGRKSPLYGRPLLGGTKKNCKRVTKIALLVQFDDNIAAVRDGKPVPNFEDVMRRERQLAVALGFDLIYSFKPEDFKLFGAKPSWKIPRLGDPGSIQPLLDKVDEIVKRGPDCCTEIVIFINAHQNKSRRVRFNRKDVPYVKNNKNRKTDVSGSVDGGILARLIVEQIQKSTRDAKLKCQPPAELIFHSCYSGNLATSDISAARKKGLGITASSQDNQTTKGSRNGARATTDSYYFLDALESCAKASPGKTLADIFDCVVRETRRLAGADNKRQEPKRLPPITP